MVVTTRAQLSLWALPRAEGLAEPTIATGDAQLDAGVHLGGDRSVLAVLDAPTRRLLLDLVVGAGLRIIGGELVLAERATSGLEAHRVAEVLAQMTTLRARLERAVDAYEDALVETIAGERDDAVLAALARRFPEHPSLHARVRAEQIASLDTELHVLADMVDDIGLPLSQRLDIAKTVLARALYSGVTSVQALPALNRLAAAKSLPQALRAEVVTRLLTAYALVEVRVPDEHLVPHLSLVVTAMMRNEREREIGAAFFARAHATMPWSTLTIAERLAVATALVETRRDQVGRAVFLATWRADAQAALTAGALGALGLFGLDFEAVLGLLGAAAVVETARALVAMAPTLEDPVALLGAAFMELRDEETEVALVRALASLAGPRASDLLVLALSNAQDAVVDAAIAALAEVGDVRAIKALKRLADRPIRSGDRPARAQAAIDQIAARKGDPTAGLSLVDEAGRLSLPEDAGTKPKRVRR